MTAATLAAVTLAPSCIANPHAFTDGLTLGALTTLAALALAAWRTRRR